MKKYRKEIIIFLIQLGMFYVFPMFVGPGSAIAMVLLILVTTFGLSALLGALSNEKIKIFYPVITAISFIPTVFIYYNDSALIHSVWYLVVSAAGIGVGMLLKRV